MPAGKAILTVLCVAAFAIAVWFGAGFYQNFANHSAVSPDNKALLEFAGIQESDYVSYKFDKLRELVNAHSVYKPASGVLLHDEQMAKAAEQVYKFAAGDEEKAPALEGTVRAGLLRDLIRTQGFKARLVTLFNPHDDFKSHTMIEAYNPRTRGREIQDPVYNVFFAFRGSIEQRVAVHDMLAQPLENFTPCLMDGYCGWQSLSSEGLNAGALKPYFAIAYFHDDGTLAVSKSRFAGENPDEAVKRLCRMQPQACSGKTVFVD